jgi:pimeloyl-ACP methyl ester carboxylesterase
MRASGRRVVDCAADVAAILDAVGAERCYTVGTSGGGPHSLACAAALPERTRASGTIAGVAPWGESDLDFLAGMGPENVEEFGAALEGEERLRPVLERWAVELADVTPEQIAESLGGLVSDVDKRALTGELARWFVDSSREALRVSIDGWLDDDLAFTRPWGFDLGSIEVPVLLRQGEQDLMVPPAHGRWLAARIAGVDARIDPSHGHISLGASLGPLLDEMLARVPAP